MSQTSTNRERPRTKKVIRVGSAERWLQHKRKEQEKVEIKLTRDMVGLVNAMIRNPASLPLQMAEQPVKPYSAKDEAGSRQVGSLTKWLTDVVMQKMEDGNFMVRPWKGELTVGALSKLRDIVKHYEPIGLMCSLSEVYWSLRDALEGREPEFDSALKQDAPKSDKKAK